MTTIRISPTEVQVADIIYVLKDAGDADEFEACVATVGVKYCELEHRPVDKRYVESDPES